MTALSEIFFNGSLKKNQVFDGKKSKLSGIEIGLFHYVASW